MSTKPSTTIKRENQTKLKPDILSLESRIKLLIDRLKIWIGSEKAHTLWTAEFTSPVVAGNTVEDLLCQIPCNEDEWLQVVRETEKFLNQGETWIFLLPSSHSVASLYPLSVAYLMGIKSIIKCSRRNPGAENVILEFISYMNQELGADISTLDPTLGLKQTIEVETAKGIFCFGADQTIHWLKSQFQVPIAGAGHGLSVCIVAQDELEREMAKITKDIRALGGRGCMSTKAIILLASEQETEERVTATIRAFNEHLANTAHSETDGYRMQIFDKEFLTDDEVRQLLLECSANVIPTIVVRHSPSQKNHQQLQTMIRSIPEIQWITMNGVNLGSELTHLPLGESQAPKWDGRHGSTPLFQRL